MTATTDRDGAAILAGIIDHPEDDLRRLVYADWLEERGEAARAEFIRVQIRVVGLKQCRHAPDVCPDSECLDDRCEYCRGYRRSRALLSDHAHIWFHDAHPWLESPPEEAAFAQWWGNVRRGFIWRYHLPLAAWMAHGPALAAAHPVELVEVSDRRPARHPETLSPYYGFLWTDTIEEAIGAEPWVIPRCVWNHLSGYYGDSVVSASSALSRALIAYARSR